MLSLCVRVFMSVLGWYSWFRCFPGEDVFNVFQHHENICSPTQPSDPMFWLVSLCAVGNQDKQQTNPPPKEIYFILINRCEFALRSKPSAGTEPQSHRWTLNPQLPRTVHESHSAWRKRPFPSAIKIKYDILLSELVLFPQEVWKLKRNCMQSSQGWPESRKLNKEKMLRFGTPVVTPPLSIQSSSSHNQPPSAVFGDIGLVFLTPLSWSANEIYRQKGMQREIAFSSSDVLAVTTISMALRVFLLFFSPLFLHLLSLTVAGERASHHLTERFGFL